MMEEDPLPPVQSANKAKKPRKRMKAIMAKIRQQMEFYFSDSNLHKDRFLKQQLKESSDGYVELSLFLTFNRIRALTTEGDVIAKALAGSSLIQVSDDMKRICRRVPLSEPTDVDERTVYVECLPLHVDHEWVRRHFSGCGRVSYVSIPKYRSTHDPKGFAFVEFETVEGARKACEELNNPPVQVDDRVGKFPKSSKTLEALKRKIPADIVKDESPQSKLKESSNKDSGKMAKKRERRTASECSGEGQVDVSPQKKKRQDSNEHEPQKGKEQVESENTSAKLDASPQKRKLESKEFDGHEKGGKTKDGTKYEASPKKKKEGTKEGKQDQSEGKDSAKEKSESELKDATKAEESESHSGKKKAKKRKRRSKTSDVPEGGGDHPGEKDDGNVGPQKRFKLDTTEDSVASSDKDSESASERKGLTRQEDRSDSESGREIRGIIKKDSVDKEHDRKRKTLEMDDEEPAAKQVRREVTIDETPVTIECVETSGKKKRTRRKKKRREKDMPEIRVIPKKKWLELRAEYLQLQKASMATLKKTLVELKHQDNKNQQGQGDHNTDQKKDTDKKKSFPFTFVPGVVVKVTSSCPLSRKKLKDSLGNEVQIAYIDVVDNCTQGYVRCKDADSASKIVATTVENCTFSVISDEEEKSYWDKMRADREAKLNSQRPKKRGMQKLIDKANKASAENVQRKHTIFEDD